jgi:hypothetical protein
MTGRDAPLPNRRQARRLVVSLAVFWGVWAVGAVLLLTRAPAASGVVVVPALAAGFLFYYTLYEVWSERTGRSALRMMVFPGLRASLVAYQAMFTMLRPSWFIPAMRATGWRVALVGALLGGLLVLDLGLVVALFLTFPTGRRAA